MTCPACGDPAYGLCGPCALLDRQEAEHRESLVGSTMIVRR